METKNMNGQPDDVLHTDVLAIGGGAVACMVAISCQK